MVQLLLNKPGLDPSVLSNFRPKSKLPFISKVLKKIVYSQLKANLEEYKIMEVSQSGLPQHRVSSLKGFIDIFPGLDAGEHICVFRSNSSFDTVDQDIFPPDCSNE